MPIRKKDVKIGGYYGIRHDSDPPHKLSIIQIEGESIYGGYNARKLKTNRLIRIRSAAKLRCEVKLNPDWAPDIPGVSKWMKVS